jgi:hypothetical protein
MDPGATRSCSEKGVDCRLCWRRAELVRRAVRIGALAGGLLSGGGVEAGDPSAGSIGRKREVSGAGRERLVL